MHLSLSSRDIVLLEAGGVIAADLRLIEANDLQCDESALTGESVAVDKRTEALAESDMPLGERSNMAYKGTAVTQGSGSGIVLATGMDTELGHISCWVEQAGGEITPLEKRLDALGAFATALLVLGMAPGGQAVTVSFLTFGFARLWHIFNMRDPNSALLKNEITGTPLIWIAILVGIGLLLAAVYTPFLAEVLSVQTLGSEGWALCLAFSILPLLVVQAMKLGGIGWERPAQREAAAQD